MGFGSVVSMGVLATAAIVLGPQHIQVDSYEQAALMFVPVYGRWAITLFALALGVGCLGAAIELTLNIVLDLREGAPRLTSVLIGASALGHRLHPTIGRWVEGVQHALGVDQAARRDWFPKYQEHQLPTGAAFWIPTRPGDDLAVQCATV
jgi:hypothetical protein